MAKGYSKELVGVLDGSVIPPNKADGRVYRSRHRIIRAVFDLSQSTVAKVNGDTNSCGVIPRGHRFQSISVTSSVSLGSSTIAFGYAGSAAAFKSAAVFTAVDTPTGFGPAAARAADPFTSDTEVLMTIGAADLPSSGIIVIDISYTGR